jgi:hypothetical protein
MPKGVYDRSKTKTHDPDANPTVQEIVDARMQMEVPAEHDRIAVIEKMAGMTFSPHMAPRAGYEYIWEQDGKLYSIIVKDETVYPREMVSNEFHGGSHVFITKYREGKIIETNDPRLRKQIQPDPGPKVFCKNAAGECFELTVGDFLELVNKHRAKAVCLARKAHR